MTPFPGSFDVVIQREKTRARVEVAADGTEEFNHYPPPGQGWTFEDGDSAKGTWVRILSSVVDEVKTERAFVMTRPVSAADLDAGWNVWGGSRSGELKLIHERLSPAEAVTKAVQLRAVFDAQLDLPEGWSQHFGVRP